MAKSIIQYRPQVLAQPAYENLPGMSTFLYFGKYFTSGIVPMDRTGTIQTPITMKNIFPIPELRPMKKSFEDLCDEQAQRILRQLDALDTTLRIFWSGGIDSTLMLISLLKHASEAQKKRFIVLMTEDSIAEYPRFYEEYIHGKLQTDSASLFPYMLGGPSIMVSGEQNDQLFGADMVSRLILRFGASVIHEPYRRENLFTLFNEMADNPTVTNRFLDLFERVKARAPIPIRTHFDYFWWINFSLKWQNAFMRILTCTPARRAASVTPEYIKERYVSFFGTDDFQLWSMNNLDKRIKDEWRTYKWVCKDIIYDYTKDAEYRANKTKHGSLRHVLVQQDSFNFIDEDFKFYHQLDSSEFYVPDNDFVLSKEVSS